MFPRKETLMSSNSSIHYYKKNPISVVDIMRFMTHDSLRLCKFKGSSMSIDKLTAYEKSLNDSPYRKGVVFVSPSKNDLEEGKGYVVTSYETLQEKYQNLTHWTPNIFRGGSYYNFAKRIIKGHTKQNLKQINVIGLDIDTKEVDLYALYLGCEELGLPRPNLLLETPAGFQFFFVLETPFFIHKEQDYKALRVAERLAENIREALKTYVPVDFNCNKFGFYRIPKEDNVLDFYDKPAKTNEMLTWSRQYEEKENRKFLHVVYKENRIASEQTAANWYQALIHATQIEKGHFAASRNNALFTLALANYTSGRTYEAAYDELDQFNSNLDHPLRKQEFERILNSAYSGKYKGVKRSYVEGLLGLWTDGKAQFKGGAGWYKFKKAREDRERSHYDEWEQDILDYLEDHTTPEIPFLEGSLKEIAETLGMAVSSLKEVLKRSDKLVKRTIGRGRGAVTKLTSRTMLFRSVLLLRKQQIQQAQLSFAEVLPGRFVETLMFPTLSELLLSYEVGILYRFGPSPPRAETG